MTFKNVSEVKNWLRNINIVKGELKLKIKFYKELEEEFNGTAGFESSVKFYKNQVEELQEKLKRLISDTDKLFSLLDENERLVMTARYINMIRWDYIELHVYYSRRQAIRVHDGALLKLVGQTVGELNDEQ